MQVRSLESNVDNTTLKINHFWKCMYKCYGLEILHENASKVRKCRFASFVISHILNNLIMTSYSIFLVVTEYSIENICSLISFFTYWIQSSVCLFVLYKKQNQLSHCLNQLLQNISAKYKKRAWKLLQRIIYFTSAIYVTVIAGGILTTFRSENFLIAWKIMLLFDLFVSIFNETTKVAFVYLCILLAFNFECLTIEMETCMMSFSSLTEKNIVRNHHYKFYRIIHWINEVNELFDLVLAAWIAADIITICAMLRFLIIAEISWSLSLSIDTLRTFCLLLLIYKYAALVKEKARVTAIAITKMTDSRVNKYDVQIFNLTDQSDVNNWKCHLFMHDLSLTSVGINVSGYFIISKESILTLIGTLITYMVIMFQTN
uniref:Gustatory receptor n=1 Tax=Strigamia maritima TaxID=126957 RepID=T1JLV1_STRMM